MANRPWVTVALVAIVAFLVGLLVAVRSAPPVQAQASEGQADKMIAVAAPYGNENLLYLIDTAREVVLVYGFHSPGQATRADVRNGAFEFLAGRLYRWDVLLCSKREYAIRGPRSLEGLRPTQAEEEYKRLGQ